MRLSRQQCCRLPSDRAVRNPAQKRMQNVQNRFTTYETYEISNTAPLVVIKKDNSLEIFDRNKILTGLLQACYKRPVTTAQINRIVDETEAELKSTLKTEFRSEEIGTIVMDKLKELDDVSYVRFASVYREFKDVETFVKEISELKDKKQRMNK